MKTRCAGPLRSEYDVIIAGARCAGAATALLLARQGVRVLVVDPARRGSDTLSTHALMRGAVLQLHRWGVLDEVRAAGTPALRSTTFHYGHEAIEVPIKARDGVDALYAPRRRVLDAVLVAAAERAGAEVLFGYALTDLLRGDDGRVRGATVAGPDREEIELSAPLVIGADGVRSRVARIVGAEVTRQGRHATASIYAYHVGLPDRGNDWFYADGAGAGAIPTNDGEACVFVSVRPERFTAARGRLDDLYRDAITEVSPLLSEWVADGKRVSNLRGFAGIPGFFRRSAGPGWALVGDAGYFKDPLTAHGITDAFRDAELLARAVVRGGDAAFVEYEATRNEIATGLFEVTDRIASLDWTLEESQADHMLLSKEMSAEVAFLRKWDTGFVSVTSDPGRTPTLPGSAARAGRPPVSSPAGAAV